MSWFWLNVPLDAAFFLAVVGIPAWLVLRRPDSGPAVAAQRGRPVLVPVLARPARQAGGDRQANSLAGSAR